MAVNVLQELEEWGVAVGKVTGDFAMILCPFHPDTTPSMRVRLTGKGQVGYSTCYSCGSNVTFPQLLYKLNEDAPKASKVSLRDVNEFAYYLSEKYHLQGEVPVIPPQTIDRYTMGLPSSGYLLQELEKREVSLQIAEKFKLGCDGSRITIPVYNEFGDCINVYKYLPGCTDGKKLFCIDGKGKPTVYPWSQLVGFDTLILAGGLIKALACTTFNDIGIGAVSLTHGEKPVPDYLARLFSLKKVYVIYDVDDVGRAQAEQAARSLYQFVLEVKVINLNFDVPKGGVDDYLSLYGKEGLHQLIQDTKPWTPEIHDSKQSQEILECSLTEAVKSQNVGRRVRVPIKVVGACTSPYYIPKTYKVICDKAAKPEGMCSMCPMYVRDIPFYKEFEDESKAALGVLDKTDQQLTDALKKESRIPLRCKNVSFKIEDYRMLEDIRISPMLNLEEAEGEREDQLAICYTQVEANSSYLMEGRIFPHPDSQKAIMICSKSEPLSDDITNWSLEEDLQVLQDASYEEILLWMERNVTKIYNRPELHAVVDLIYHTPLMMKFGGDLVPGWGQALILGDAGQGKSQTTNAYCKYLGIGTRVECKNASVAGLLGGCANLPGSRKQFIKWGAIPANDRKLVLLEELSGASTEILGKLTDMRSEGIAQIPKIESKSTKARTRIIAVATPRSGRPLNTYSYGVEAIYELMGSPADIRRFDLAICLKSTHNKDYIDGSIPEPSIQLNREIMRASVLFAWTRKPEQIVFSLDVVDYIQTESSKLLKFYEEDRIPLINRGAIRFKVAKLSAALAARKYSVDPKDPELVIVKEEHVDWIISFLDRIYRGEEIGYYQYCKTVQELNNLTHPEYLEKELKTVPYVDDLVYGLSQESIYQPQDIMDWGGLSKEAANSLLSVMRRTRAIIRRGSHGYIKTPGLSKFLREWPSNKGKN